MTTFSYFTLDNGLRAVHMHEPGSATGYFGTAVRAGSRDEDDANAGLAHFVEHTIFKGTDRRTSWHIINRMEAVGGELNAFTTKEDTVVYTAFARGNLTRAVELIADLVRDSRFPDKELNKEREVVKDEIDSYLDQPAEAVYDDFEDLLFKGTSLGHNILGNTSTLETFDSSRCRGWLRHFYRPDNMVAFYAGSVGLETFRRTLERYFGDMPSTVVSDTVNKIDLSDFRPFVKRKTISSHQSNVVMGAPLPAMDMNERMVLAMLSNILGGPGMNSRLNIQLRERRGLVYTVEASSTFFTDCGEFTVYFGCDPEDEALCTELVKKEIKRMADTPLTDRQLSAAKKQYLGQLILAEDNRENRAISTARATLMRGRAMTSDEVTACVNAVTAEAIAQAATNIYDRLSVLTLSPV